jgi:hypothetical protein
MDPSIVNCVKPAGFVIVNIIDPSALPVVGVGGVVEIVFPDIVILQLAQEDSVGIPLFVVKV